MSRTEEKTLQLNDSSLDYVSFGSGAKTLVMIPGLSLNRVKGSGKALAFAYKLFAKEYRVYMFDCRNETDDTCSIAQMAADLYEAMKQCGIASADVLGVSMGGMIAQNLAADHPEIVDHLVVALSAPYCSEKTENKIRGWLDLAERSEYKKMVLDFMESIYSEAYMKKYKLMMPLLVKMAEKADLSRFTHHCRAILNFDLRERLNDIQAKTYVIGAKQDQIVDWQDSLYIAEKLNTEAYIYPDLGHGAYDEAKDFNKRVLAALKGEQYA